VPGKGIDFVQHADGPSKYVAVLISGTRSYLLNRRDIRMRLKKNLLRPLSSNGVFGVRIFICTSPSESARLTGAWSRTKNFDIVNSSIRFGTIFTEEFSGINPQAARLKSCFEESSRYEREHLLPLGKQFDFYVRTRPDLHYHSPMPKLMTLDPSRIHTRVCVAGGVSSIKSDMFSCEACALTELGCCLKNQSWGVSKGTQPRIQLLTRSDGACVDLDDQFGVIPRNEVPTYLGECVLPGNIIRPRPPYLTELFSPAQSPVKLFGACNPSWREGKFTSGLLRCGTPRISILPISLTLHYGSREGPLKDRTEVKVAAKTGMRTDCSW